MTTLSIVIKTLNEEANIARAIESCIASTRQIDCEIIIADSGSADRTIEIAQTYPVTIVQVRNPAEGRCGLGPQLGYQFSSGRYVYILDGDMELRAEFLTHAIVFMDGHPDVAGFGGVIEEMRTQNIEFESRRKRVERYIQSQGERLERPHERGYLPGGALYRRAALVEVGYMSDRNLHGNEEYDLGARLRVKGWKLVRSNTTAANHYSHQMPSGALFWYRMRSGMLLGVGEIVRAGADAGYLMQVLKEVSIVRIAIAVYGFWALVTAACIGLSTHIPAIVIVGLSLAALIGLMCWRNGSLKLALFSLLSWHAAAIGLLAGVLAGRRSPTEPIDATVMHQAISSQPPAQGIRAG
jgi:GT2 family glycosyltransferase